MFAWFLVLLIAVFMVATSSIGMECYDQNKGFSEKKMSNKKFLSAMLWTGVAFIILFFLRVVLTAFAHV